MLRLSDRGVPPHMLHLHETKSPQSAKTTEFHDDAVRLPTFLAKISTRILARLKHLRGTKPQDTYLPNSAKADQNHTHETQYLGEVTPRDTRRPAS